MSSHYQFLDMKDACVSLIRRPLRSFLSSLGIGIGITALIAMLSIGEGAKKSALEKIESLGTNTLRIENRNQAAYSGGDSLENISKGLVLADAEYLAEWLGSRGAVGAYVRKDSVVISKGSRSLVGTVLGVSAAWFQAERVLLQEGRLLNSGDIKLQENFCVVGANVASILEGGTAETILSDHFPLTVVGILEPRGRLLTEGTGLSTLDFDSTVILPFSSIQRIVPGRDRDQLDGMVIALNDTDEKTILSVAKQIEEIFLINHRGIGDYSLVIPMRLIEQEKESQHLFSLVMGTIAGLSLLVGGIGVMNVMLANIAEQTREIGLRMAVGASRIRIANLYLWNSLLLTMSGALWGILVGIMLALTIQKYAGWDVAFSSFSLVIAPFSAMVTGLVFGIHPAIRAASLEPALALRDS